MQTFWVRIRILRLPFDSLRVAQNDRAGADMKEFWKTFGGYVGFAVALVVTAFGYLAEIFPQIVPNWVYNITGPVGMGILIVFLIWLIKERKKK